MLHEEVKSLQLTKSMSNEGLPPEFWQSVVAFNHQNYYECHDLLEALWSEAMEPDRKFYQGILQLAVAFYHLSNSNWRGSVTLLGEGLHRLQGFQPEYGEVNVAHLINQCSMVLDQLQRTDPEGVTQYWQSLILTENGLTQSHPLPTIRRIIPHD